MLSFHITQRRLARIVAGICAAALLAGGARADRDIVYSARYYYPPRGPARVSRWHLYRINPDGSGRKQITFGEHDDLAPVWSPDGRRVLFTRAGGEPGAPWGEQTWWLCVVSAEGGRIRTLLDLGKHYVLDYMWSPDGHKIAVLPEPWDKSPAVRLVDVATKRVCKLVGVCDYAWSPTGRRAYATLANDKGRFEVPGTNRNQPIPSVKSPVWLSARLLAGMDDANPREVTLLDADGRPVRFVELVAGPSDQRAAEALHDGLSFIQTIPGTGARAVVGQNCHDSTTGTNYCFFTADLRTGIVRSLADGQFLSWSPDGSRFCTAPGRDLGPYGKKSDGSERTVWVAPLKVGTAEGKLRTITPGTVWVVGGDWRKAHGRKR